MTTTFSATQNPFPRWVGPYSVARGTKSGFRFRKGRLGTWVEESPGRREFWEAEPSAAVKAIERLVREHWHHGRVLLLPDGHVAKPDPDRAGDCIRYLIGRIHGSVAVVKPDGTRFDLSRVQHLRPGAPWPGPHTTGIEVKIDSTGQLNCEWELAAALGRLVQSHPMWGRDPALATGLRAARPGLSSARVRVQIGGAVVTMQEDDEKHDKRWRPRFVGHIDIKKWPFDPAWVML